MTVETTTTALRQARLAALEAITRAIPHGRARWAQIPKDISEGFANTIRAQAELASLEGKYYSVPGRSGYIDYSHVAAYLIDRSIDTDAAVIAEDLFQIARNRTITLRHVQALAGVLIEMPLDLGNGVCVVPGESLISDDPARVIFHPSNKPHLYAQFPTAAVTIERTFGLELFDKHPIEMHEAYHAEIHQKMATARRSIMLASRSAPEFREGYVAVTNPGWVEMSINGHGGAIPFPVRLPPAYPIDAGIARRAFSGLTTHPEASHLNLAISKLEASRRREAWEEQAIDQGTCLEVLLMHGGKDNAEIRYKIGTRAAWLLGNDGAQRLAVYKLAQDLYDLRSKAVHSGEFQAPKSESAEDTELRFANADNLCARLILKVIELGTWPNWDRLVLNVVAKSAV